LLQIYPTSVTPFTKIEEWYRAGLYKPYADEDNGEKLIEVLIWFKERVQVSFAPKSSI
jgi:elongator complex protein 3